MSWGGSQQSMDVVFCPFFLARILDPQVSNLCLSSLMGWSEVLLGFYLLARPSAWPFSWTPSLLLHAQNWQMHQGNKTEQNRTEQNTATYLLASGAISLLLAPCTFIPWLPDLNSFVQLFCMSLTEVLSLSRCSIMPHYESSYPR